MSKNDNDNDECYCIPIRFSKLVCEIGLKKRGQN